MPLTPDDEALLKDLYLKLEDKPLEPGNAFYQPVYERPEGEDPVAKMLTHVEWAPVESLQLFSGFRGSGKTTELFRLRQQLKRDGYCVVYCDALEYLNPADEIDIGSMLLAIAGAFGDGLEAASGVKNLTESFWTRVRNYLRNTSLQVVEANPKLKVKTPADDIFGSLEGGLDLKVALKTAPSFRQKLAEFLANRLGELKREVNAFVEDGVKAVRKKTKNPDLQIVFLFDQLEQIRGSLLNEQTVIRSVERLFANHLSLLKLPYVHAIYTVPPWLQFVLPGAFTIETLPSVRQWKNNKSRSRYRPGWELLRALIVRRFGEDGFVRVFGKGRKGDDLADRLLAVCGGHFRDLLRLFRESLVLTRTWGKQLPLSEAVVERAITNVRDQYLPIADEDADWLREIERKRNTALPSAAPEHIGRLSRFLDTHLVLYLTNGEDWYDVHPLIRDELKIRMKKPAKPRRK